MPRIYTAHDERVEHALTIAVDQGLVAKEAPRSTQLRALVLYADERLTEQRERDERVVAYRELAKDEERLAAIEGSVLAAVEDGIL